MLFKMFLKKGDEGKKTSVKQLLNLQGDTPTPKTTPKEELPPRIVICLNSDDNKYYQYDAANERWVGEYKEEAQGGERFTQGREYVEQYMGHKEGELPPIPNADDKTVFEVPINESGYNQLHHQAVASNAATVNASAKGWD